MGLEEIFVFFIVGCVASYRQRSHLQTQDRQQIDRQQIIFLWVLAIACPSLAIAWITFNQTSLPLVFVATGFLLCVWIYRNWRHDSNLITTNLTLTQSEEKQLKGCFPPAIYHLKDVEYRSQEIYCHGNLRSQTSQTSPQTSYDTINQNLRKIFGDRFVCYLQENSSGKYCFYLIPSGDRPKSTPSDRLVSIVSLIFTVFTVLFVGANIHKPEDINFTNLASGIPYLVGIASVFLTRAIVTYYISKRNQLRLGSPLWLPCVGGFGLLGSFSALQPRTTQRRALFDLAAIPTIAGLIVSLILLTLGNWILVPANSAIAYSSALTNFDFKNSIFANLFQRALQAIFSLAKASDPISAQISTYSPLTLAGWTGLALSALQLMPFDLLDGGHLTIAMFGHRQTVQIARFARLGLLAIALLTQPWLRIYSLLIFLLPTPRPLILNESIEIGRIRDLIGLILIAIALLIILPVPKSFL
jgi:membrane-associated protease RseP (regulator of RpoE activity)